MTWWEKGNTEVHYMYTGSLNHRLAGVVWREFSLYDAIPRWLARYNIETSDVREFYTKEDAQLYIESRDALESD